MVPSKVLILQYLRMCSWLKL